MSVSNRGAAQVSVIWMIGVSVILLVTAFFAFMSQQKAAQWEDSYYAQVNKVTAANEIASANYDKVSGLSEVTGFNSGDATGHASPTSITLAMEELKATFPGAADATTVEQLVPAMVGDYNALASSKQSLTNDVSQLRSDLEARSSSHQSTVREKDSTISDMRTEMEDLRRSMGSANVDLENQRDNLRDQVRDLDRQVSELRLRNEDQGRTFKEESRVALQRRDILSERLDAVARRSDTPDGAILTASVDIGRAWIDLGRVDRVRPGMVFAVSNPLTGASKGQIKILSIEDNRSECSILNTVDRFDPISSDDLISNAVYDRNREPVAVLLGNGFGKYSAEDMKNMLREVGISTAASISKEADYLILGTPFFDEDTGDVVPWESYEAYKLSQAMSVQLVPFRDAMTWIGL